MATKQKYAYEILLQEKGLTVAELPDEAKMVIGWLEEIEKSVHMHEKAAAKKNKTFVMSAGAKSKVQAYDKWVMREVMDHIDNTNTNNNPDPDAAQNVLDELKKKSEEEAAAAETERLRLEEEEKKNAAKNKEMQDMIDFSIGDAMDFELKGLYDTNKRLLNINEIRDVAPKTYAAIHKTYKSGEENGIKTYNFLVKEKEVNEFEISPITN